LVGTNTGTITNSTGSGVVTSPGANSTVSGLVEGTGGVGSASNPPAIPNTGIPPLPANTGIPPLPAAAFFESLPGPVQVINNLVGQGPSQFAALNAAAPVFNTVLGGIRLPPQQPPGPTGSQQGQQPPGPTGSQQGQQQQLPVGFDRRVIDIPPPTETRFVKDEVVLQIAGNVTVEQLQAAVGRLGLTLLASENLAITGSTVVRFRITDGRSPAEIIRALAAIQLVAVAQPNYVYTLQQQPINPGPASPGDATQGDPAQYMLEKLKISDAHRMVRGANVAIAVIDSEIDVTHPDLEGAVTERFDAVGAPENSHAHGTGMAGAIAAHRRLLGTAPAARLLAVHAFSSTAATAESTTFNILKGINWSVQEGARIINMSFAGPRDPSLARALKAAYDKGIVLIAAAGNAGPKSPPLFPGAIPFVIAVTATDVNDKLFTGANRGKYISVAAPGVDILVPAPEGEYQITTGTSVAAAEVSGIVALLLERNPKLTPADIRRILTASAKRLAPGERDDNFGSGLIDPLQALQLADPRIATTRPPRQR
jgi:subtilisin family serine protease